VDQSFRRAGGADLVRVDVRIISSSSRDLNDEISEGRFREDLYHRLNVVPVEVPPLSHRREDIEPLVESIVERLYIEHSLPKRRLSGDALAVLQAYDWPGNVRQLRNIVERTLILAGACFHALA